MLYATAAGTPSVSRIVVSCEALEASLLLGVAFIYFRALIEVDFWSERSFRKNRVTSGYRGTKSESRSCETV